MSDIWRLGDLPFVINANPTPSNHPLPDVLPFSVTFDRKTGLIRQAKDELVEKILTKAYEEGSMLSGFMDESGLGRKYADDFLRFMGDVLGEERLGRSKVLEIGCGTGYMLSRLQALGAEVVGIEPGLQRLRGGEEYGVTVIDDFFPTQGIRDYAPFHLIVQYAVLEHIEQVPEFLNSQRNILGGEGLIAVAVPDCEPYIARGDISMFIHEHYSYCTQNTLCRLLLSNGFQPIAMQKARFGGSVYCIAKQSGCEESVANNQLEWDPTEFSRLVNQAKANIQKFKEAVCSWQADNGVVGIYCPGRALNALFQSNIAHELRFFDDNKLLHGKYFPGFPISIESFDELKRRPVSNMLVMSDTFGQDIAEKVRKVPNVDVHIFSELFA